MGKKSLRKTISTPICLVGMPGAGKTVMGQEIAKRLGMAFFDADAEIEAAANMSICDLFATYGEDHFRRGECQVITRLLSTKPCVIATGGGAFIEDDTRHIIQTRAISVYLSVPLSILWERVQKRSHRPLLAKPNGKQVLCRMYKTRTPVYQHAHISIPYCHETTPANTQMVIDEILKYTRNKILAYNTRLNKTLSPPKPLPSP